MNWRSLGFRLSCLFSALLLAALVSLSAALWWSVEFNMIAAVDELLEARASSFDRYAESEFGNVFIESRTDPGKGEFRGRIEEVDWDRRWLSLRGTRIRLTDRTEFEGSLRASGLRAGQFGEVEVQRASAGSDWEAATVAVVADLAKEMKESFGEYAMSAPDGHLIQFRNPAGETILPVRAEAAPVVSWREMAPGLITVATVSGSYRCLRRDVALPSGAYRLQMASSLAAVAATRAGLLQWAWWIFPLLVVVSLAGGIVFSRAALRPLEEFSAVTSRITAQRLTERMEARRTGDVIEHLARTFNSMLDRLESSVKRLDEFTADASHELRGPAAVIRTTAELALRQNREGENLRRDIAEIHAEAVRLTGVIEDLLAVARADNSPGQPSVSEVDLSPLVTEVVAHFHHEAGPRVTAGIEGGPFVVRGHEASLRRLLLILVDNALRHNPEDTAVRISLAHEDGQVVLTVADSGGGIDAAHLPRLFDRFYRADPARSRSSGAGLGLAIAQRIVQAHGGQIAVSSTVGSGSMFRVSLQAHTIDPAPAALPVTVAGRANAVTRAGTALPS